MPAKEMYDYLSAVVPDSTYTLNVKPANIIETVSKSQEPIKGDDLSELVLSFTDSPIFSVILNFNVKDISDSGTVFDFWLDSGKGNGAANKFLWYHPHDGYTYVVRFHSTISRGIITNNIFKPSDVTMRVFGYLESTHYLRYTGLSGSFSVGDTVYGMDSGASATIEIVDSTNSKFWLTSVSGTFQDGETIYTDDYGSELLTDPNIESWTGDNPDYWSDVNTPTVTDETGIVQSGSHSLKFVIDSAYDGVNSELVTIESTSFYLASFYLYGDGTNYLIARMQLENGATAYEYFSGMVDGAHYVPPASWTQHSLAFSANGKTGAIISLLAETGETAGTHYIDSASIKKITTYASADGSNVSLSLKQYLAYTDSVGTFSEGNRVYGATSGAEAVVQRVDTFNKRVYLESISGTFQNSEYIYEADYEINLVQNWNMELDGNWNDYGSPTVNIKSHEQKYGGSFSRKYSTTSSGSGISSDTIQLDVDEYYLFNGFIYISSLDANYVDIYVAGLDDYIGYFSNQETSTGSWIENTNVFKPQYYEGKVYCAVFLGNGTGTVYVDNVTVKKIRTAATVSGTLVTE